jgi:hypothetical protein
VSVSEDFFYFLEVGVIQFACDSGGTAREALKPSPVEQCPIDGSAPDGEPMMEMF